MSPSEQLARLIARHGPVVGRGSERVRATGMKGPEMLERSLLMADGCVVWDPVTGQSDPRVQHV